MAVFVEAKRAFSKQPEPPPSGLDAQKPRVFDAQHLYSQAACVLRATVTQFLLPEHPKCERGSNHSDGNAHSHAYLQQWFLECERGAHLAVRNGNSHAFLRGRALRMRAWRSSSEWEGQQLRKFVMSGVQNAGVATSPSLGRATVPGAAFTRVF